MEEIDNVKDLEINNSIAWIVKYKSMY